jgi:uncharacterized membrane protein (DUF373 family)
MSTELNGDPKERWGLRRIGERLTRACEVLVVSAAALLVMVSVILAAIILFVLFIESIRAGSLGSIDSTGELQQAVEKIFSGVLLLLLGLELLKMLTSFFLGHHLQLEIIVAVAMIAVARHVMLVDFAHIEAANLLGAAALMLALAISYALVRHRGADSAVAPDR